MNYVEQKYVRLVSVYLQGWKHVGPDLYRFRCPFCGDSDKNKNKARGYFFALDDDAMFKCHNCQLTFGIGKFLAEIAPQLAGEYRFERFTNGHKRAEKEETEQKFVTNTQTKLKRTSAVLQTCTRLLDLPEDHYAREYIDGRMIPGHHQRKLYYIEDVTQMTAKISGYEDRELPAKPAIVIPFFDEEGVLMYLQCRFFSGGMRYLTFQVEEDGIKVWGLDRIDWNKPVYICEGPFDAMFVDNCIAVAGVSILSIVPMVESKAKKGTVLIFDKDYVVNKDVYTQLCTAVKQQYSVVMYDQFFKHKDINDQIQHGGWDQAHLMEYFKGRTRKGLSAQMELTKFRTPIKPFKKFAKSS